MFWKHSMHTTVFNVLASSDESLDLTGKIIFLLRISHSRMRPNSDWFPTATATTMTTQHCTKKKKKTLLIRISGNLRVTTKSNAICSYLSLFMFKIFDLSSWAGQKGFGFSFKEEISQAAEVCTLIPVFIFKLASIALCSKGLPSI